MSAELLSGNTNLDAIRSRGGENIQMSEQKTPFTTQLGGWFPGLQTRASAKSGRRPQRNDTAIQQHRSKESESRNPDAEQENQDMRGG